MHDQQRGTGWRNFPVQAQVQGQCRVQSRPWVQRRVWGLGASAAFPGIGAAWALAGFAFIPQWEVVVRLVGVGSLGAIG